MRYTQTRMAHTLLIVGGGFGGVTAARHLAKRRLKDLEIVLLTERNWLEYYGVLYRLLTGSPFSQACIPLAMVLPPSVKVVVDRATSVDAASKTVKGEKGSYAYDTLVLAPGAEPAFFGIPGMQEHSQCAGHAGQVLRLKGDVEGMVRGMGNDADVRRIAVIGAGATGVEFSSDLLHMARSLAGRTGVDPSRIQVDLIEAADRVLPLVEPKASAKVLRRLRSLGVNVRLQTAVESAEKGKLHLKGGETIDASMILWTAGVKASSLVATVAGIELDKRGRAVVDDRLRAKGLADVFVVGDSASTKYAGMAQTAVDDGIFLAKVIAAERLGNAVPMYAPRAPAYAIPAGPWWAAVKYLFVRAYGFPGYVLRRLADIHVYMLVMPWRHVHKAYFGTIPLKKYGIELQ